ncbi:arsenate reductase [Staphylococcus aureus]|uniref:Arsenate reductase n=1 Tax=Staphylococcus aureus TaxID=1280 RepID=A0A380DXA5_STAAU|nr:arsenate reductase [Staphylococcus aureus]
MGKKTIYFICTGNSCRSQMAEGWGKKILGESWNVYSAGIKTHGVNPKAIEAMKEVNIDISNHTSDLIDDNILKQSDLVVTLCSDADNNCPILPPNVKKNTGVLMIQRVKNGQNSNALEMKLVKKLKNSIVK